MRTPKLRYHKGTKRYLVGIGGRDIYLGKDRVPAEIEYHRLMQEYAQNGGKYVPAPTADNMLVCEVIEKYVVAMQDYYRENPSSFDRGMLALRHLNRNFGHYQVTQFDMTILRRLREAMMQPTERGKLLCRNEINRAMREVTRFWKWAASYEYAPAELYAKCITLEPLKRGHSAAPETKPVHPVTQAHIDAVKARVNRSVRAMIDLQLLTGARPGEIVSLRASDIDRSGAVWKVELLRHKTAHRGKTRVLYFGQQAQVILRPFLLRRRGDEFLFSPQDYLLDKMEGAAGHRRENQADSPRQTDRSVGDQYDTDAYRKAIARACVAAGIPHWHPHQLRHTAGTELRKAYGVEVARAVLGHSHLAATEIYAEVDAQVAERIAAERG